MEIKYTAGKFENYTAKSTFSLGTTGITIMSDSEVGFDGTIVIIDGERHNYPQLRGAIKVGWLVLTSEDNGYAAAPMSANIGLRPAVGTQQHANHPPKKVAAVTVESDERIVMTQTQRKESPQMMKRTAKRATESTAISNEGEVVVGRRFKTPAASATKVTSESVGAALSEVNNVKIDPGKGISGADYLNQLSPEAREEYLSKKAAARSAYDADAGVAVVSHVKTAKTVTADGITSTIQMGGGTEIADLSGLDSVKAVQSTISAEGMTFRNTNGPKKVITPVAAQVDAESKIMKDGTADARKRIAKSICADFPEDYSFDDHWKRRLARIQLHYSDQPKVIQAIFAAESDDFKKVLLEEFPEAFGG